jgi:hypothetical protein
MRMFSLSLFCLLGCQSGKLNLTDTDTGGDTDTEDTDTEDTDAEDTDTEDTDTEDTDTDTPSEEVVSISGSLTWTVDFWPASEATGLTDCDYTRSYSGQEDRSLDWLCPECEIIFRVDVEMTDGRDDCYTQVTSADSNEIAWLGYGDGLWYRAKRENLRLFNQGSVAMDGDTLTVSHSVDSQTESEKPLTFGITGSFTLSSTDSDPMFGFTPPDAYECGWSTSDLGPYTGDYGIDIGATLPDGLFMDQCGEPVQLYDLAGGYLVVDISALDCGPCRSAASELEAFRTSMAAQGVDVTVATLMAPSISSAIDPTPISDLGAWADEYGLESPVLADRGYGYWVIGPYFVDYFGFPTTVLISPDLEIFDIEVGYSGWDDVEEKILNHAASL